MLEKARAALEAGHKVGIVAANRQQAVYLKRMFRDMCPNSAETLSTVSFWTIDTPLYGISGTVVFQDHFAVGSRSTTEHFKQADVIARLNTKGM